MFSKILFGSSEWMLSPEKMRFILIERKAEGSVLYAAWVGHPWLPELHGNEELWQQKLFLAGAGNRNWGNSIP